MLREWLCKKMGHKRRTAYRKGLVEATWPTVAARVTQRRQVCVRCGITYSEWERHEYHDGITSLTMPDSHWDEMRETGMDTESSWYGKPDPTQGEGE